MADALGIEPNSRLQPITYGFDWACLAGAWPAPTIQGAFLHGDVDEMVRGVHSAELRRRGFGISAAEILLLLGMPCGGMGRALRGLDVQRQPLLPPFVLRARVDHYGPIDRSVKRDLALRDFIGCHSTVPGRLRVGEDADGLSS